MQCQAMDILTEEKMNIIIRFNKVSVGTNFYIGFNNSEKHMALRYMYKVWQMIIKTE